MAMSTGSPASGDAEVMVDINTTPLIDVMLVLLIMLIITIPIQLHAVNLTLPVGAPPVSDVKPEVAKIDIDEHSALYWQGVPLSSLGELETRLRDLAASPTPADLHLRPNKRAKYEVVAAVLASTKRLGLTKVAVIGSEQFVE
jgi:biopolymer transport protein ExbD